MKHWMKNVLGVITFTAALQVVVGTLIYRYPFLLPQMIILTLSTNLCALFYALLLSKSYMDSREEMTKLLQKAGIEPPTLEGAVIFVVSCVKPYLDILDKSGFNDKKLQEALNLIPKLVDMAKMRVRNSAIADIGKEVLEDGEM